jgi:hypothetical protein
MEAGGKTITSGQFETGRRGYKVRSPLFRHLLTFLMVAGPGLIVMEADNDAGAVSTYTLVRNGILLMFCNAAILGTTAISLSSAWAFSEVRGWKKWVRHQA